MGAMQRNKGKRGEREVIGMLLPIVAEVYHAHGLKAPVLKRNTLQSDGGGDDIAGLDWISIEVKYHETPKVNQWWAQTLEQAGTDKVPVLIYRRNKVKWSVCMYALLGEPSTGRTVRATVDIEDFLEWFRQRLHIQLSRGAA